MRKIREVLRLFYAAELSSRAIARSLRASPSSAANAVSACFLDPCGVENATTRSVSRFGDFQLLEQLQLLRARTAEPIEGPSVDLHTVSLNLAKHAQCALR